MSIFEAYDAEFSALRKEIVKSINDLKDGVDDVEKSPSVVKLIDGLFLQSNDLIKQMELEARSSDQNSRKVLNERLAQYKKATQSMKSDFQQLKVHSERAALVVVSKSGEQRQRLLDSNHRYESN